MKYVITKNNAKFDFIMPNTRYEVSAIYDNRYPFRLKYPKVNPLDDKFFIMIKVGTEIISVSNIYFKSNRELNLEKILSM